MIGKTNSNFETIEVVENYGYKIETEYETDESGNQIQILHIYDWDYVPAPSFDRVFANNTPAQISVISEEIAKNGYTSSQVAEIYGWNLGDTIPITLSSGENIEMQIIGINHDTLSSDHTSKAGLTVQMKECLATKYPMNSTNTNAGGYAASIMKTETLPTLKALLPQEWQDIIKLVDKKSANGGYTNYTETLTLSEDIFLLSEIEVFGTISFAQDGENEGSQYEYWNGKADTDRIKKYDTDADGVADTLAYWWLRSSVSILPTTVCSVNDKGSVTKDGIASQTRGVAFGFCI